MCDQPIATEPELIQINDDEAQRRVRCGTMREPGASIHDGCRKDSDTDTLVVRCRLRRMRCSVPSPETQLPKSYRAEPVRNRCRLFLGAALVGMVLHIKLPHHLQRKLRDVVKLVMGQLEHLSPETDLERMMQTRALQESEDIARSRCKCRAAWQLDLMAIPDRVGFLDQHVISWLRSVRARQRNRHRCAVGRRALVGSNTSSLVILFGSGTVLLPTKTRRPTAQR